MTVAVDPVGGTDGGGTSCRRRRLLVLTLILAVAAGLTPAPPARAQEVTTGDTRRVLGGLSSQTLDIRIDGRRIRGHALRFRDAPGLELRPHLARGTAAGLMTMPAMAQSELTRGAIAGVNGGYFLPRPQGVPNGLFVDRGRMVAGRSVGGDGRDTGDPLRPDREYRAIAGIQPGGTVVADRIRVALTLDITQLGRTGLVVDEINRAPLTTQINTMIVYDHRFGATALAPAGSVVLVVDDLAVRSTGTVTGGVRARHAPTSTMGFAAGDARWPSGTSIIVASGTRAADVVDVPVGAAVGLTSTITPDATSAAAWADLRGAIPGAGLLLRNGSIPSATSMSNEGINHASSRRARTAVGRLASGHTILVTTQETVPGDGITLHELARVLRTLGATDAVALDGGGSTHMTVRGRTFDRPSDLNRAHSSALFVYAPLPPTSRTADGACPPGLVPPAGFADIGGNTHRVAIDCLAWWGVTQGVSPARYGPSGSVSRQQMASFLARWLDDLAGPRGQGNALPASADHPFTDVGAGSAHETAIARLAAAGVLSGTTATTYNPAAPVTRAQTATLVANAVDFSRGAALPEAPDTFMDDNGNRHEPAIDRLAHAGVIGGTGGYDFTPDAPVTRAAMASLIMRASDLLVTEGRVTPPTP